MKIPKDIHGYHKIRDSKICSLYATDAWTMEDIAQKFGLTQQRVNQIVYKNRHLLSIDKNYERIKQFHRVKQRIKTLKEKPTTKDILDWEDKLTDCIQDDKLQTTTAETKVIIIKDSPKDANNDSEGQVSRPVSIFRV